MSINPTDKGLLTPDNCVVIFIDHQPELFFDLSGSDRQELVNRIVLLAKAARIFRIPVILTAIQSRELKGEMIPELRELFPEKKLITRSTMNSWDSPEFIAAVKQTCRENLVISALWSEVCLAMPALQALTDGYFVFAVEDASLGASAVAYQAALRRIEQAGGVPVTSLQLLFELQRDWARSEHYDEVIHAVRAHSSLLWRGVENAAAKPEIDAHVSSLGQTS